ncbi:MAG: hypothetical protein CSA13_01270 [Clostridiales bacterium]|nr:MAG: hypothetical protein CSA13_01270 [Clostridiales bacterium]
MIKANHDSNMDKLTHQLLTGVMYITYFVCFYFLIANNTDFIAVVMFAVIFAISIVSHHFYYSNLKVDQRAKIVLVVQMALLFVMLYFDKSEVEYLYLFLLVGDAIFAFEYRFSILYSVISFALFVPFNAYLFRMRYDINYFEIWHQDVLIVFFVFLILYLAEYQIGEKMRYDTVLIQRNRAYRELANYAKKVEEMTLNEERNRISYMLHNSLGHMLVAINLSLQAEKGELKKRAVIDDDAFHSVEQQIKRAMTLLRNIIENADDFVKTLSMNELLEMLISNIRQNTAVDINYQIEEERSIPSQYNNLVYNIVMESITNALKHATPTKIDVSVRYRDGLLVLKICDDGCGFTDISYGFGIEKMIERVERLQGKFQIIAQEGCMVSVEIPIEE